MGAELRGGARRRARVHDVLGSDLSANKSVSVPRANVNRTKACTGQWCAAGSPPRRSCGACGGETPATGVLATGTAYVPRFLAQNVEEVVLVLTEVLVRVGERCREVVVKVL